MNPVKSGSTVKLRLELYGKHAVGKVVQYYVRPGGRRIYCKPLRTFSLTAPSFHTPVKVTLEIETTPDLFESHTINNWEISKDFIGPALETLKDVSTEYRLKSGHSKWYVAN